MDNQQGERTIYFKDLVFSVLYKWRAVLVAMLIGAVLLGGMEWLGGTDDVTLHSVSLTPENQLKVDQYRNTLERTERLIDSHAAYLQESILISLDSYKAYTAGVYVSVETEDAPSAAIVYAYHAVLMDTATMETVGKQYDMAPVYLAELISVEVKDTNVLGVTVRGRTLEEAEAIAASLRQAVEAQQETVTQAMGPHKLQMRSFRSGPAVDKTLFSLQDAAQQRMTSLKNTAASATTELNRLLPTQLQPGKTQPLLFAVVGGILGALLVAAAVCVMHVASAKVYSARTLKDRTGVRILGRICGKQRKSVDRWLRKLEGRAMGTDPDGIVVNIANRCAEYKQLLVFGSCDEAKLRPLTEALTNAGIQCTLCAEAAGSAQALKALPNCDAAVLVETCGESTYDDVIWTVETVNEYGKPLLGCVLLDA